MADLQIDISIGQPTGPSLGVFYIIEIEDTIVTDGEEIVSNSEDITTSSEGLGIPLTIEETQISFSSFNLQLLSYVELEQPQINYLDGTPDLLMNSTIENSQIGIANLDVGLTYPLQMSAEQTGTVYASADYESYITLENSETTNINFSFNLLLPLGLQIEQITGQITNEGLFDYIAIDIANISLGTLFAGQDIEYVSYNQVSSVALNFGGILWCDLGIIQLSDNKDLISLVERENISLSLSSTTYCDPYYIFFDCKIYLDVGQTTNVVAHPSNLFIENVQYNSFSAEISFPEFITIDIKNVSDRNFDQFIHNALVLDLDNESETSHMEFLDFGGITRLELALVQGNYLTESFHFRDITYGIEIKDNSGINPEVYCEPDAPIESYDIAIITTGTTGPGIEDHIMMSGATVLWGSGVRRQELTFSTAQLTNWGTKAGEREFYSIDMKSISSEYIEYSEVDTKMFLNITSINNVLAESEDIDPRISINMSNIIDVGYSLCYDVTDLMVTQNNYVEVEYSDSSISIGISQVNYFRTGTVYEEEVTFPQINSVDFEPLSYGLHINIQNTTNTSLEDSSTIYMSISQTSSADLLIDTGDMILALDLFNVTTEVASFDREDYIEISYGSVSSFFADIPREELDISYGNVNSADIFVGHEYPPLEISQNSNFEASIIYSLYANFFNITDLHGSHIDSHNLSATQSTNFLADFDTYGMDIAISEVTAIQSDITIGDKIYINIDIPQLSIEVPPTYGGTVVVDIAFSQVSNADSEPREWELHIPQINNCWIKLTRIEIIDP